MLKLTFFWHQLLLYYSGEPLGDIFVIWMMKQDQKWQPFFCQFLETKQTRHLFDDIRWDMTSLYYMFMSTYWISITLSCIKPIRTYTLQFYYAYTLTSALSKVISLTKGTQLCWAQRKRPSKSVRLPMYATSWCEVCVKKTSSLWSIPKIPRGMHTYTYQVAKSNAIEKQWFDAWKDDTKL